MKNKVYIVSKSLGRASEKDIQQALDAHNNEGWRLVSSYFRDPGQNVLFFEKQD